MLIVGMAMPVKFILLLEVDVELFKICFGRDDDEWKPYELKTLSSSEQKAWTVSELVAMLQDEGIQSVVVQHNMKEWTGSQVEAIQTYLNSGGVVAYFGIEDADTAILSSTLGLPPQRWRYSAYTKGEYELTGVAHEELGYGVMEQPYTKCNLLCVPVQDRWMVTKAMPLHRYIDEVAGTLNGNENEEELAEWNADVKKAKEGYINYCEMEYEKCPLAVYKNKNNGKLVYMGFVNGQGNIPKIVKAVLTRSVIPTKRGGVL